MRGDDQVRRMLEGVGQLDIYATIGLPTAPNDKRERRHIVAANLHLVTPCPAGCKGGGYELAQHLFDSALERQRSEGQGHLRCRGFLEPGGGRRLACDHTLLYRAIIVWDARRF